jgi:hypothetical protein
VLLATIVDVRHREVFMRHRLLILSLMVIPSVMLIVVPATAAPPGRTASVSITANGECSFTVEYVWTGFSGTGLTAEVAIGYKGEYGANIFLAWTLKPNQSGSGGSASATFTLSGSIEPPRQLFGHGNLFSQSSKSISGLKAVRDAVASSDVLEPHACGSDVSLS